MIPRYILNVEKLDYENHLRFKYGHCCQVHENETHRNIHKDRTQGYIFIEPCSNLQGGYRFMSLTTGKKITRYIWYDIPIPDKVINQVKTIGKDQPEHLTLRYRKVRLIGEVEITGMDEEQTETPYKTETVKKTALEQSSTVNEEMAYQ